MDWTTLGTVLGSNFFIALVSLTTAKWQINSAREQFNRQLKRELDRERKERRQEIRSKVLLKLREEIASFGIKMDTLIVSNALPTYSELHKAIKGEIMKCLFEGEVKKTAYLVGEAEFMVQITDLMAIWSGQPLPTEESEVKALILQSEQKIVQIEWLINKRLEEL